MLALHPADPAHDNHLISTKGVKAQRVWHHDSPLFESTIENLIDEWHREVTETCGFIDSEQDLWIMNNIHEKPRANFLMHPKQMTNTLEQIYVKERRTVLGIFHTHPNNVPWPSPRDIVGWPNPKLNWRYFVVIDRDVLEWELVSD